MFDLILRDGLVVDGTGRAGFQADIGILGDRIVAIGELGDRDARESVDCSELCVCPGFIDMHSHSDLLLLEDPHGYSKVTQGVTSELVGQCGFSPFPLRGRYPRIPPSTLQTTYMTILDDFPWTDLSGYANAVNQRGSSVNLIPLVGHIPVRAAVMGYEQRDPTPDELAEIGLLVDEAMEQGAFGFSSGLTLVPSSYAQFAELLELSKVVAKHGGIYDTHARFWAGWQLKAAEEAARIGSEAGLAVHIAHLAVFKAEDRGQAERLTIILDQANENGVRVTFDLYPYVAAGTELSQLLPGWVQEGGASAMVARLRDRQTRAEIVRELDKGWHRGRPWEWDSIFIVSPGVTGDASWTGKHLLQIAQELGVEPKEALLTVVDLSEDGAFSVIFNRREEDVQYLMQHPLAMIGSDGNAMSNEGPFSKAKVHPRCYGTYPRVLGRYVRDLHVLPLENAVYKMTGAPAACLGLKGRGTLMEGYVSDITVFDPAQIIDCATFEDPHQYSKGVRHVMVSGKWVLKDGQHTSHFPGGVLLRGQ